MSTIAPVDSPPFDPFPPAEITTDIEPLIDAIAADSASVFVGAGASASAGLPLWREFLTYCVNSGRKASGGSDEFIQLQRRLDEGDFLIVAELLQKHLGSQLEQYIWRVFGHAQTPSSVHRAIAAIPFSLAFTTNYDRLLERAYRDLPPILTWQNPAAILNAIKNRRFALVKTHGDVGNAASLVLTKTQYRDLVHLNKAFNDCLGTLLAQRVFLFVGHSLKDHDILHLMDNARLVYGDGFGPHYAILFEDEVNQRFIDYLRDSYSIRVILCKKPKRLGDEPFTSAERSAAMAALLREIGGRAALKMHSFLPPIAADTPLFSQRFACNELLARAVKMTGSFRGDVCLKSGEERGGQYRAIRWFAMAPHDVSPACTCERGEHAPIVGKLVSHSSVIGRIFLQRKDRREEDAVYISDTCRARELLAAQEFHGVEYHRSHTDVRSQLACPVVSDGMRIGVLNVESEQPFAYTRDHALVLRMIADQIGWACYEAEHRRLAGAALLPYFSETGYAAFAQVMMQSRLLSYLKIRFILWKIDPIEGRLQAYFDRKNVPKERDANAEFIYAFDEPSLATRVLRERRPAIVDDAEADLAGAEPVLNRKGCEYFNIRGPVVAVPLRASGHTAAVLVAWSADGPKVGREFRDAAERIRRLGHLIANDPYYLEPHRVSGPQAEEFSQRVDERLRVWDHGRLWTEEMLWSEEFRTGIIDAALNLLLEPCIGLRRARLWRAFKHKGEKHFRCIRSITRSDSLAPNRVEQNAYVGVIGGLDDSYVQYTQARFKGDPYARVQHCSMFGCEDRNSRDLDKAEGGAWFVAPIVRPRPQPKSPNELLGYLSADCHYWDNGRAMEEKVSIHRQRFQRYAMDVITDIIDSVLGHERRHVVPPPQGTKELPQGDSGETGR